MQNPKGLTFTAQVRGLVGANLFLLCFLFFDFGEQIIFVPLRKIINENSILLFCFQNFYNQINSIGQSVFVRWMGEHDAEKK